MTTEEFKVKLEQEMKSFFEWWAIEKNLPQNVSYGEWISTFAGWCNCNEEIRKAYLANKMGLVK